MNRRQFIKQGVAATAMVSGTGMLLSSCKRDLRNQLMDPRQPVKMPEIGALDADGYKILYYASLAPSGHNSQPWAVKILSRYEWIIGVDPDRCLPAVDSRNREVMLSLGTFVENLVLAAGVLGYTAKTTILTTDHFASQVVGVSLSKGKPTGNILDKIEKRRTIKSHMLDIPIKKEDVAAFSELVDGFLHYFPKGGRHAQFMEKEAVDNFVIQFENKKAMTEMAQWTRLKDREAMALRDGLTPDGMEISGIAGWYVRNFMKKSEIQGKTYKEKGIEKIKEQVRQGGGWMVITSDGNSVADLILSGRRFQRMALAARERHIAIHPMTQTLEEKHGQKNIRENHGPQVNPQFMLRVGYVDPYPEPVSLRRPVEWFTSA